jgi:hypothetical protein
MPKIEDQELTEKDIGREVYYYSAMGRPWCHREVGVLSSFNETGIWVRFRGPTGEKCPPEFLFWRTSMDVLIDEIQTQVPS